MRRANNNSRGQWVDLVYMPKKGETLPPLVGYLMKQGTGRIIVAFTKGGELYDTHLPFEKGEPIEPPKWAANLWDITDEASKVNHYALLYDARYNSIISDCYEGKLNAEITQFQKTLTFLTKLKAKEPWQ